MKASTSYDTKEAIVHSLASLSTFNELIHNRHLAGYVMKESLNEFVVMGKWLFDSCGNCMQYIRDGDDEVLEMPESVMTLEEFNKKKIAEHTSWSFSNTIPPAHLVCPVCKKRWDVKIARFCREEKNIDQNMSGEKFVGATLKDVKQHLDLLTDACYIIPSQHNIRNDKHIDLTPKKGYETLKENERGWVTGDDNYVIQPGDEISFYKYVYYHKECLAKKEEARAQELIKSKGAKYNHLCNLAGNENCDPYIKAELTIAGIRILEEPYKGEVPYHYIGLLGKHIEFKFTRAWTYWVVSGPVPLKLAEELYADPEGVKYVRVAGHCGCPAPKEWAGLNGHGELVVDTYHIDTLCGLKLFAEKISAAFGK